MLVYFDSLIDESLIIILGYIPIGDAGEVSSKLNVKSPLLFIALELF